MALIGFINVALGAETKGLVGGLKTASSAIKSFSVDAQGAHLGFGGDDGGRSALKTALTLAPLAIRLGMAANKAGIGLGTLATAAGVAGSGAASAGVTIGGLASAAGMLAGVAGPALLLGGVVGIGVAAVGAVGAIGSMAGALVGGVDNAALAASNLNEQISKTGVVFGAQTATVVNQAELMAHFFGIPKTQILEAASNIGLLAKGAGLSGPAVAEMANQMSMLAIDSASFYNVPVETALMKIRAGLTGESEPLRDFGVLLNEAAVKAEAARMGLVKYGGALTEGQKVQARASLIAKGLTDAQGDLIRTASSASNMMRELQGRSANMSAAFGQAIQPVTNFGLALKVGFAREVEKHVNTLRDFSLGLQMLAGSGSAAATLVANARGMASLDDATMKLNADVDALNAKLREQVDTFGMTSAEADIFALKQGGASSETLKSATALAAQLDQMEASKQALAELGRKAEEVAESVKTPAQAFNEEFGKLNELLVLGAIDFGTFAQAVAKAKDQLAREDGSAEQMEKFRSAAEQVTESNLSPQEKHDQRVGRNLDLFGRGVLSQESFDRDNQAAMGELARDDGSAKTLDDMKSAAEQVKESIMTPMESFRAEMARIEQLRTAVDPATGNPLLTDQEAAGAGVKARKDLGQASKLDGPRFAGAMELGSQEARSAVLKFQGASDGDGFKGLAAETQKQTIVLGKIHTALRPRMGQGAEPPAEGIDDA